MWENIIKRIMKIEVYPLSPLCANVERDIFVGLIRVWG